MRGRHCVDSIARAKQAYDESELRERLARYHGDNVDCAFRGWNDVWLHPDFWHWNIEELLPNIRVPVLATQGDQDEYGTGRQLDAIAAHIPNTTIVRLSDCRHSPHLDQPAAVLDAIADWLPQV